MIAIRKAIVVLLIGGLFGVPLLFAQVPAHWVGVWRLSFEAPERGEVYWVIANDQGKFSVTQYSSAWRPIPITVSRFDENTLSATFQPTSYRISAAVTKQGERLSGTWKLAHVQYSVERPLTAVRVVRANNWEPLEGIRRIQDAAGVADVCAELRRAATERDFEKFKAAWDSEIGAPYYLFLEKFWDPDPVRQSERLRQLYRVLRSSQFPKSAETMLALHAQAVQLIKDKRYSFYYTNPTILLPTLSAEDVSAIDVLGGKVYVKAEVPEKLKNSQARLKWLVAKEHIRLAFLAKFPLTVRATPVELIREGVSAYLAADLLGMSLAEILGATPLKTEESLTRLEDYRKAMARVSNAEVEQIKETFRGDPLDGRQIIDLVGYKFGEQLAQRFKAEEIAKLDRVRLLELANNYLGSGS